MDFFLTLPLQKKFLNIFPLLGPDPKVEFSTFFNPSLRTNILSGLLQCITIFSLIKWFLILMSEMQFSWNKTHLRKAISKYDPHSNTLCIYASDEFFSTFKKYTDSTRITFQSPNNHVQIFPIWNKGQFIYIYKTVVHKYCYYYSLFSNLF